MWEIMKFYNPKWVAVLSILFTVITAVNYPAYAFLYIRVIFILLDPSDKSFEHNLNILCGLFLVLGGGLYIFTFL
jgi:hypothetical protein